MHKNSYWMSFKKKKALFLSWSSKQKCMKLKKKKKKNDIERNSTKFY